MDSRTFLQTALALFAMAALGGLTMLILHLRGKPRPPSWLALGHGLLAGAGLTLMVFAAFTVGIAPMAQLSLVVLVIAAFGGLFMNLRYHAYLLPLPMPLMLGHAMLAVSGVVLLMLSVFWQPVVS